MIIVLDRNVVELDDHVVNPEFSPLCRRIGLRAGDSRPDQMAQAQVRGPPLIEIVVELDAQVAAWDRPLVDQGLGSTVTRC